MDYRDKAHAQQVVKQQEYNRDFNKAFWNPKLENEAKDVILDSTFFDLFTPASWQSLLGLNISGGDAKEIKSPAPDAGGSVTVDYRAIDDAMDGMPDATVDPGYYDENIDLQGGGGVAKELYDKYESLPLPQQIALGVTPGTGEVISAYETPKFAGEAKEAFDKGEYLESIGKGGLATLSALGAIPGLGLGIRAIKGGAKAATKIDEIGEGLSSIFKSEKKLQDYGDTWKAKNKLPDNQRQVQDPIVKQAAQDLDSGKIKGKQFRDTVKEVLPIKPIDEMMDIPTFKEIAGALKKDQVKKGIVGVNKNIPDGTKVATRLDIPAYNNYDKWIVSIHEGIKGPSTGYSKSARLKNVNFGSSTKGALRVSKGADKATFARMEGNWTNTPDEDTISFAERLLKNKKNGKYIDDAGEEWVQVGMNPYRGSYFYDKATGQALQAADELIQVGPLVFAKGAKKPTLSEYKKGFTTTTEAGNKVAFAGGGQVLSGLDNLYMNNRNSKHKLDNMLGFKERQYGGGLDDAYMNRRRSSAFAAPDATSAFASPMSMGGLPTIYRQDGGDFNYDYSFEDIGLNTGDFVDSGDLGDGNYFTDPGLTQGQSVAPAAAPAAAPQGGPSGDIGSDVDTGGYGVAYDKVAGLLGLQRADPNQPNIGFEAYFNPNDKGSYDVGMPASPSTLDPIRNLLNKALPNVFGKPSGSAFVVGKDAEDRRGAYNAAMKGYEERGLPRDQYDSWFSKNAGNLMEGYRKGGDAFDFHANKISTDASNKFNSALEYNKNLESNKGKTEEEVANETVQELFGPTFEKAGTEGYPIWAPGGSLVALTNAIGKATGKIGTVTLNGVRMEVNKDGTLREEPPVPTDIDYGNDPKRKPKETPETEMATGLANQLKKKSIMGELLRKEKKERIDPNIQIIMDIYGLTLEEAQRFLGKSGVGTGGVGEFEGI